MKTCPLLPAILSVLLLLLLPGGELFASPNLETYGQLPRYSSWSLSPDGKHISYIFRNEGKEQFIVQRLADKKIIFVGDTDQFKARSTFFATDKHVLLFGSETRKQINFRLRYEDSGALALNIETGKFALLLDRTRNIYPAQSGLGNIVGIDRTTATVYMPAFTGQPYSGRPIPLNLYEVNLDSGLGKPHKNGTSATTKWFVQNDGTVLAREDFMDKSNLHRISVNSDDDWKAIYEKETDYPHLFPWAIGDDGESLLVLRDDEAYDTVYRMSLKNGKLTERVLPLDDGDAEELITDRDRKLLGIRYSGFKPRYLFKDKMLEALMEKLEQLFPASSIYIESLSADRSNIVFLVSGADAAGAYYLYQADSGNLSLLGKGYDVSTIGSIKAIRYPARDGKKIPALITLPPESKSPENLPAIVIPHGGPEAYDGIEFNWLTQYLAAKGYLVLQPNFRGSTGFGYAFRDAGHGEWGGKMQDDISDGVLALTEAGYIDPKRVCILGMSYGGYAALAGGAFTPDLYRCVISVNGLSNLNEFLNEKKRRHGLYSDTVSYWRKLIGDETKDENKVNQQSPVNFANQFSSPTLLIHGKDDTVVSVAQSKEMHKALMDANKPTKLITLSQDDHWLSNAETRIKTLREIDQFLDEHNPVTSIADQPAGE